MLIYTSKCNSIVIKIQLISWANKPCINSSLRLPNMKNELKEEAIKNNDLLTSLGNRIKELRQNKKLTQAALAALMNNRDSQFIQRLEKGRVNMSIVTLRVIAEALEVDIKDLL